MNLYPLWIIDLEKPWKKNLNNFSKRTGKTFVYITHSLEEAMVMSDRIAIMKSGQFEQIANADEIYEKPKSSFVAEFMGEVNLFEINGNQSNNLTGKGLEINLSKTKITKFL